MKFKFFKIPLVFLAIEVLWAVIGNSLIIILFRDAGTDRQNFLRTISEIIFVFIFAMFLFFGIKRQQKKPIVSENGHRHLFEMNPNPMWVYDTKTFRFVRVNAAAIALYGYSGYEFLSMTIKDIMLPSDNEDVEQYVCPLQHQGIRQLGTRKHLKKCGELLYVSISSYCIQFENRPCNMVMINNITNAIINEKKMRAQNIALQEVAWSNSHEVRHSLCSIISLTELLMDSKDESEKNECLKLLKQCTGELDLVLKKIGKKVDELEKS